VSERFESYAGGLELANGFGELTDARQQRRRFRVERLRRRREKRRELPLDEEFLRDLTSMPEASGVALGFDRLVMLLCGARRIGEVAAF
jgi:lysyl-tRNA synthetase class 2